MKPATIILVVAGGACAGALGARWLAVRERARTEAAIASLAPRRTSLDAAARRYLDRLAASERDRAALRAALRTIEPGSGAAPPRVAEGRALPDIASLIGSNPELFRLGLRAYRAGLAGHFGRLYRDLGLSPAQIAAFEDLMTEHEEGVLDLGATAAEEGFRQNDPAVLALRQQQDDQLRAAQVALLGEEGYRRLQQIDRMQPVMDIVTGVATTVATTAAPLSRAQAAALTDFLANSSSSYRNGSKADPETIDWDTALPQAGGLLDPTQAAALKAEADKARLEGMRAQFDRQNDAGK